MYDDDGSYIDNLGVASASHGWHKPVQSLYDRCTQTTHWTDASNITRRLEDMTPVHRQNLLLWLERRAPGLHEWAFENGKISYADRQLSPKVWLHTLPLVKRLMELSYCAHCGHVL